jgi:hypothetical protein
VLLAALLSLLQRRPSAFLNHLAAVALIGLSGLLTFAFAGATAAEQQLWVECYRLRKGFYEEVTAEPDFAQKQVLVCRGFPGVYKDVAHSFLHDSVFTVKFLHPERSRALQGMLVRAVSFGTSPGSTYTSVTRSPLEAYPAEAVLEVVFQSSEGGKVVYCRGPDSGRLDVR